MHDAAVVGAGEGVGHFFQQGQRLGHGNRSRPVETVPQRLPVHVRHDVVDQSVDLAAVVQRENVGMLEVGRDVDFGEESPRGARGHQYGTQDLDRHRPVVPEVAREVDRGHAAGAELALDVITASQSGPDPREHIGHGDSHLT